MLRAFYAFLIVAGLALGVFGAVRAVTGHKATAPPTVEVVPTTFSRALTPGNWSVYTQAGTGQYGTVLPVLVKVEAPGGTSVPVTVASAVGALHADGKKFVQADNVRITTATTYRVVLTLPPKATSVEVLLAPSPRTIFPWVALAIDGVVLFVVGSILTEVDARSRRHLQALEAAYASS